MKSYHFKIGLFVVLAIATAVAGIILLGAGKLFQTGFMVETYLDQTVQGLDVGSPVKYRGVKIGSVKEIIFVRTEYTVEHLLDASPETVKNLLKCERYVCVRMELREEAFAGRAYEQIDRILDTEIKLGLRIRLTPEGLTGLYYLETDYLDPVRNPVPEICWRPKFFYIPSAPGTITQFTESLDTILQKMERVDLVGLTNSMKKTFEMMTRFMEDFDAKELSGDTRKLLADFRETNQELLKMIDSTSPVISETNATVRTAREILESSRVPLASLLEQDIPAALENAGELSRKLSDLSDRLPDTIDLLQGVFRQTGNMVLDERDNIRIIIENFRRISEDLKRLAEDAKKYPSQFFFGEPPARKEQGKR